MFKLFLILLCVATVAYCQTECQKCVKKSFDDMKTKFENKIKGCFKQYNCTPSHNHTQSESNNMAKPNRFPGLGALEKKMNMTCVNETIKNCFKNANLPKDYNFTYMKGGEHHGFGEQGHFGGGMGGGHGSAKGHSSSGSHSGSHEWTDKIQKMCPNSNADAIEECISSGDHHNNAGKHGAHPQFNIMALMGLFCNVTKNCSDTTGQDCVAEANTVRKAVCSCMETPDLRNCSATGKPFPTVAAAKGSSTGLFNKLRERGQEKAHGMFNMMDMYCKGPDMCAKGFRKMAAQNKPPAKAAAPPAKTDNPPAKAAAPPAKADNPPAKAAAAKAGGNR